MKKYIYIFASVILLTSCSNKKQNTNTSHHWEYTGEAGPEHWSELESCDDCAGQRQSPINIIDIETVDGNIISGIDEVKNEDHTTIKSISNNGHTIQYNFIGDLNVIKYKNEDYKMKQFHFHSPSEHTINGVRYPLEIHIVHHSEKSDSYIVYAILVQQGEQDPIFTFLEKHLPIVEGETKEINKSFDFSLTTQEFFGTDSVGIYSYEGSLTTPPCTQKVTWVVVRDASTASAEQIKILQDLMPKNNYRETQAINSRKVYHETISDM